MDNDSILFKRGIFMNKHLKSFFVSGIVLFSVIICTIFTNTEVLAFSLENMVDDIYYDYLDDGTIEIVNYLGDKTELEIPREINGKPVTSIGSAFVGSNVEKVIIPDTVTSIGYIAFSKSESLKEVIIPDSVTEIGKAAFMGCKSLSSVKLSNKITAIHMNSSY